MDQWEILVQNLTHTINLLAPNAISEVERQVVNTKNQLLLFVWSSSQWVILTYIMQVTLKVTECKMEPAEVCLCLGCLAKSNESVTGLLHSLLRGYPIGIGQLWQWSCGFFISKSHWCSFWCCYIRSNDYHVFALIWIHKGDQHWSKNS